MDDPQERIRKEQDGIVLSPQRRSFNSGCFVSGSGLVAGCGMGANAVAPNTPRRPESPLSKTDTRFLLSLLFSGGGAAKNRVK
jgi:eukaryotic translation initiation factor 4E transporter